MGTGSKKNIALHVTDDTLARWHRASQAEGMSLPDWIHHCLNSHIRCGEHARASPVDLPGYTVRRVEEMAREYLIHVEVAAAPSSCIHCGSPTIVRYGHRDETILDAPLDGHAVRLLLKRSRYRCRACGRTFRGAAPHRDEQRRMTDRLIGYIRRESARRTVADIAAEIGVHQSTVCRVIAGRDIHPKRNFSA